MKQLFRRAFASIFVAASLLGCSATAQKHDLSERQKIGMVMFNERCKQAGEFIYRTADNVDGILLMKIRPSRVNYDDQFELDDPYGHDLGANGYIESFLRGSYEANIRRSTEPNAPPAPIGYLYVEAVDPADGFLYRYTGSMRAVGRMNADAPNVKIDLARNPKFDLNIYAFVLDKVPATGPAPQYGVTYDDISTPEEREYWIAGSSLKVIGLKTGEVMAERIGYMVDVAQGSKAGGRAPWLLAADHACPGFQQIPGHPPIHSSVSQLRQTQRFVEKILKPKN